MLTPDRWERVKDLFDRALDSAPGARVGLLEAECSNDPEILAEVQRLLEQWEAAGEFLANPIGELSAPKQNEPGFSAGDLVAQRFRIVRLIGAGGMGEVYEAEDQDLGERVALKTVRIDRIGDPLAQRRLRREALLARRVTHPNVCRIFDVGRHVSAADGAELAVLSMELLEGQTLAAKLKERGRLNEAEALPIVEQMCAALEAAHAAGIVHRDFKPSNVMLVGDRVVVTDFGLALADPRASAARLPSGTTLTHSGQLMGTPEYMAPEQIRTGEATPRSDIYSLGVVMYEMVTGVRPAAGSTGIDEILKRFLEPVRPPREIVPDLSRRWEAVILRCLEREPGARWASSAEVRGKLTRGLVIFPAPTRRSLAYAGISALGLALISGSYRFWNRRAAAEAADILVAELTNSTSDPALDGAAALFRSQLEQSPKINVLSQARLNSVLAQMRYPATNPVSPAAARESGWRLNADVVVFGNVARVGAEYILNCQAEFRGAQPSAPARQARQSFPARSRNELMASIRDASNWVRTQIGETAAEAARFDRLPEDVTTASWEALSEFAAAESLATVNKQHDALPYLTTALAKDPGFTLAAMRQGDILMSLGREQDGLAAWDLALSLLKTRAVTRREELRIRGLHAYDTGNYLAADGFFTVWATEFPSDYRGFFYRNLPLLMYDRPHESQAALKRALALRPDHLATHAQLANTAIYLRDREQANRAIGELESRKDRDRSLHKKALLALCMGDAERCLEHCRELAGRPNPHYSFEGCLLRGTVLAEAGRPDLAEGVFRKALTLPRVTENSSLRGAIVLNLAYLLLRLGRPEEIRSLLSEAMELRPGLESMMHGAVLFARLRRFDRAEELRQRLEKMVHWPRAAYAFHRVSAEIDASRHQLKEAAAHAQAARECSPPNRHAFAYQGGANAALPWTPSVREMSAAPLFAWLDPVLPEPGVWGRHLRSLPRTSDLPVTLIALRQSLEQIERLGHQL